MSYADAIERARILNEHLDAWRAGRGSVRIPEAQPGYGTLGWLFDQYRRHHLFQKKVSERAAKGGYERAMRAIEDLPTTMGTTAAQLPLASISAGAVDRMYDRLLQGPRKADRCTQAGYAISIARRAWNVVQRRYASVVPAGNPWARVERIGKKAAKPAASREEAYKLAYALKEMGEPHLGAAALICFEWHQRPENVLGGAISWRDYDPPHRVRIHHRKNDVEVLLPLGDEAGPFYPELETYLADLPRVGLPIVLTSGERGPARPYSWAYAQRRVREARARAGLGDHVTLDACRHGGLTEQADCGSTDQQMRAKSGHKTTSALRVYLKQTEVQRTVASRQRRDHVDGNKPGVVVRIGRQTKSQNKRGQ